MKAENIAPSFVYFLSGIAAATAVNLLTAIPTNRLEGTAAYVMSAYSLPWFGAALTLALVAAVLEEARFKYERIAAQTLTEGEIIEVRYRIFSVYRTRIIVRRVIAMVFLTMGILLLLIIRMPGVSGVSGPSPNGPNLDKREVP